MLKVDPDYAALPPREQAQALGTIHYGPNPKPEDLAKGSPFIRGIYGVGRGLNDAVEGIYQTIIHPINTVSTMAAATEEHLKKAGEEPTAIGKAAEYGAAIPGVGPFGQQLGERAAKGDVAGAVAEGVTAVAAPFAAKEIAKGGISPGARETAKGVGREVTQKYVGKTLANKVFPPPPPTPEEVAFEKTKTITEAQEAAQTEKGRRDAAAARQATAAGKQREAAFNKEGEENAAIQKRFDDAQEARMAAEKEAKNARFKGEQEHAKELRDIEEARQKDLASAEKLKDEHAKSLMRRQKEQDALDKKAKAAGDEEDAAQGELKKVQAKGPAGGGGRPTASERFLTGLLKRNVLTPEEDAQGLRTFGDKWKLRAGEGPAGRTNRLMGDVHAMRPARGMRDVSTGPTAAGQGKAATPPMTPPPSPVTFTTDNLGVRWAHSPESPEPVSIPKSVPESEVQDYATKKLADYVNTRKEGGNYVAYRARPVGEEGIPVTERSTKGGPQATMSQAEAQKYAEAQMDRTGKPHEVVKIDLSKTRHKFHDGPNGPRWVSFHGGPHPEDVISK
jgi:hypothetical protein